MLNLKGKIKNSINKISTTDLDYPHLTTSSPPLGQRPEL